MKKQINTYILVAFDIIITDVSSKLKDIIAGRTPTDFNTVIDF